MYAIRNLLSIYASKYSTLAKFANHQQCEQLTNRTLIKLHGKDAAALLQGLITNDINYLPTNAVKSIFTMFLNSKGRVLCDSLIYTTGEDDVYLIECATELKSTLIKHLSMYKLRKQVHIEDMCSLNLFAVFNPQEKGEKLKEAESKASNGQVYDKDFVYTDPRLQQLGYRLVTEKKQNEIEMKSTELRNYRWWRYNLGVGEGVIDIPPNNAFPLESNCDYLNGISFEKGCYLGQELTARTFHTGVIRKRLMPLFLQSANSESSELTLPDGMGKLRGIHCDRGLALLRIRLVLGKDVPIAGGVMVANTQIPSWWPKQQQNEAKIVKSEMK